MRPLAFLLRFGPALVMMATIFLASGTSGSDLPHFGYMDLFMKKGGHVVGYALLGLSYLHALVPKGAAGARAAVLSILMAALYGTTDEIHQIFTPGRGPGASDVLIDTVGATLGVGLRRWREARRGMVERSATEPVS